MGGDCQGAISQLTERWDAAALRALKDAGGLVLSNYAVGYDNIDVPAASALGIAVGNTPGILTETTAELAVALTFAAARRVVEAQRYLAEGRFTGWLPSLFLGKRLWRKTLGRGGRRAHRRRLRAHARHGTRDGPAVLRRPRKR